MGMTELSVSQMLITQGQRKIGDPLQVTAFVGGNLVLWKSMKQGIVSCPSAESEYRSMTPSVCKIM